jgi:hypothetical protein
MGQRQSGHSRTASAAKVRKIFLYSYRKNKDFLIFSSRQEGYRGGRGRGGGGYRGQPQQRGNGTKFFYQQRGNNIHLVSNMTLTAYKIIGRGNYHSQGDNGYQNDKWVRDGPTNFHGPNGKTLNY